MTRNTSGSSTIPAAIAPPAALTSGQRRRPDQACASLPAGCGRAEATLLMTV